MFLIGHRNGESFYSTVILIINAQLHCYPLLKELLFYNDSSPFEISFHYILHMCRQSTIALSNHTAFPDTKASVNTKITILIDSNQRVEEFRIFFQIPYYLVEIILELTFRNSAPASCSPTSSVAPRPKTNFVGE